MFEAQIAYYLNKYLGTYLEGIDPASLKISIYQGDVVLKNLRLKADALSELDLPVTVEAGLLGSLTLKVPWSALGQAPVEVRMDRLFLLAKPRDEADKASIKTADDVDTAFQSSKRQRVQMHEAQWLAELERLDKAKEKAEGGGTGGGLFGGGRLKNVIDTVIGNLQLSITNIHVRYEDDVTNPGHPFSCGITLDKLAAATVNDKGEEAFVTTTPLSLLRKALDLRRAALYFDTDIDFWRPHSHWHDLEPVEWDEWFLPGVSSARQERGGTARHREYVLQPVGGRALYTRVGKMQTTADGDPRMDSLLDLESVALRLSHAQYQSYQLLLAEVSSYAARHPYASYRPGARPAAGAAACAWWRYALRAVQQVQAGRTLSWRATVRFACLRRRYVSLYAKHLRTKGARMVGLTDAERGELRAANDALPETTMLMFRRLAHAEVQRERKREARAASRAAAQQGAAAGWVSWLTGRAAPATGGGTAGPPGAPAPDDPDMRSDFSPDEFARLVDLVGDQEEGLVYGSASPHSLLQRLRVGVGSASAELVGRDGRRVLRGGLDGIALELRKFPKTLAVGLRVAAMGVDSPEGVFVRTGRGLSTGTGGEGAGGAGSGEAGADGAEAGGAVADENPPPPEEEALTVTFVHAPQDGSADAEVGVVLRPSYVHYSAPTVARVAAFFRAPEALDFSNLQLAAGGQLERARKAAAAYAAAAMQARPRFNLRLQLDAPKIAVPVSDADGDVCLVLDLGQFVVSSDRGAPRGLSPDQAALYECVRLEGSDVAAFLVEGRHDWAAGGGDGVGAGEGGSGEQGAAGHTPRSPTAAPRPPRIPLLERCGLSVAAQLSRFPDPDRPAVRLQPAVPSLRFHLSPGRLRALLRVLRAVAPGEGDGGAGEGGAAPPPAPDPSSDAMLEGPLRVLRWTGLGRATETWAPARGVVTARGRLLLLDPEGGGGAAGGLAAVTLGADRRVLALAPGDARGVSHVVAVAPQGLEPADVLESTAAVLLRLEDGGAAEAWFRALCASQQALRELTGAGGATVPAPEWDDASSTVSGEDTMTASHDASLTSMPEDAPPAAQPAPTTLLQVDAELGELALFVAGRTPLVWWPPEEEDPVSPRTAAARAKAGFPAFVPDHVPHLAGESHIVVVRATGGTLGFVYGVPGMSVHTVLEALEVEDLLVGPRSPRQRYLACSGAEVGLAPDDDLFFDAAEDELRSVRSGELSVRRSASLASDAPARELAEFTFTIARPGTAGYAGVDTCLDVTLGTLRFYCNRPTLAALMSAGADFAAAAAGGGDGAGGDQEEPEVADAKELGAPSGVELAQAVDQSLAEKLEGSPEDPLATPVVRPGGASASPAQRTVFRMRVALSTLAVSLNYEGAGARMLSTAAVEGFCFGLDVDARGVLSLTSRLGNAEVLDGTLPDPHPYRRACGLRGDGTASLVDVEFKMYPAGARADPRVPPGLAWAHLTARLSQLQLVFLYRLLAEHLSYVSVMLAMRLDQAGGVPLEEGRAVRAEGSGGATPRASTPRSAGSASRPATPLRGAGSGPGRTASARTRGAAPPPLPLAEAQQPFVLVLDVEMDAPIIVLPRQSNSLDSLEVDLGNLSLSSKVVEVPGEECGRRGVQVLQEQAALAFSGMSCCVVQAGKRGGNVFKNQEQAWQLGWKRPLQPEARGPQPKFDLALDIPILRAVLDNGEYARITSIAAANVAEAPDPPEGVQWLTLHYERAMAQLARAAALAAHGGAPPALPAVQEAAAAEAAEELSAGIVPTEDVSPTNVRVVVSLARAELELHQLVEGVGEPQPLARFSIEDLGLAFHNTEEGSMAVSVCLPRVEGVDLRPEVPTSHNRVITSANKASFLIMEWSASPGMARQKLGVTLQKPELVVELSFLLATVAFVLPGLAVVGNHPIPYASQDLLLGGPDPPGPAGADLWLSPCARLLADRPGATEFEYDGGGHALILPPPSSLDEPLPLVLVGTGCTLRLRNLRLLHADSLALCLRLAPGARLLAEPRDGVELVEGAAAHAALAHALLPAPLQDNPTAAARAMGECLAAGEEAGSGGGEFQGDVIQEGVGFGGEGNTSDAPTTPPPCFEVSLSAVGIGLQLAQLDVAARSVHVLAATMDLGASVRLEGAAKAGRLALHGLHVESRTLDGEGADGEGARDGDAEGGQAAAARSGSPDGKKRRRKKRRGSLDAPVLEPCHVSLDFELRGPGADPGSIVSSGTATTTTPLPAAEVTLAVSDLALNLAPDVLALAAHLAGGALEPLRAPDPGAPLLACARYERVWSFVPGATLRADGGLVDLSVAGASGGVSVWRPRPSRAGYLPVGDVAVAEGAAPSFEVLAVAAGSGLAAFPLRWERVWRGAGASAWRAVPPPGYRALGDAVTRGDAPPRPAAYVCVHESALVAAALGQRLGLPPRFPHAPAASAALEGAAPALDLVCVDGSTGTFWAAPAGGKASLPPALDLRTPLGVTSAALVAAGAARLAGDELGGAMLASREAAAALPGSVTPTSDARGLYGRFLRARRSAAREEVRRALAPPVVDFARVWTDNGRVTAGRGVSVWRPVAPPGYASLGDCLVRGLDPPQSACVVRDSGPGEGPGAAGAGGARQLPLLSDPQQLELVWQDTTSREDVRLTIWRPRPRLGYVAVGHVAAIGTRAPPRGAVKCLRADAAARARLAAAPAWVVRDEDDTFPQLSAWISDEASHTFVTINSARGRPGEVWALKLPEDGEGEAGEVAAQQGGVNVVARIGKTRVLLRDAFRVPLLELDVGALDAGVQGPSPTVVQAYVGFSLSLWSHNGALRVWEPVVEPWNGIFICDANLGGRPAHGIKPGMHMSLKSSSEAVVTTLSYAAVSSLLAAHRDWQELQRRGQEGDTASTVARALPGGGAAAQHVLVDNTLGIDAAMELDFGNRLEMVRLPAGRATRILRPLPSYAPRRRAAPAPDARPLDLLLVDVESLELEGDGLGRLRGARLYCTVELELGPGAEATSAVERGAGARTRALLPGGAGRVAWRERLVLALPPGGDPATIKALRFDVWDGGARGGAGARLGSLAAPLAALSGAKERSEQLVEGPAGPGALRAAWQVQRERSGGAAARHDAGLESAGQRALSVASQEGIWTVIPAAGARAGRDDAGRGSAVPVRLGAETLALESGVQAGARRETLRTLCVVRNTTALALEVALGEAPDADAGAGSAGNGAGVVEEVLEHQRWRPRVGWAGSNLNPRDPARFEHGTARRDDFPQVDPPRGWEWDSGWQLDRGPAGEKEGWVYAPDFSRVRFPAPDAGAYKPSPSDTVRVRRWVRRRVRAGSARRGLTPQASLVLEAPPAPRPPRVVGVVAPGSTLPLPVGWDRSGSQLLLRPAPGECGGEEEGEAGEEEGEAGEGAVAEQKAGKRNSPAHSAGPPSHGWSEGAGAGTHTVLLDCLDEAVTRLVRCAPLAGPDAGGADTHGSQAEASISRAPPPASAAEASSLWFAVTLESSPLAEAGARDCEAPLDWRVVVAPPLTLVNQLPLAGSLLVWQEDPATGQLVSRQTLRVRSGQSAPVHGADLRSAVSFSFYPDGYEWMEAAPALAAAGARRAGARGAALPDRVRLGRPGASLAVEVYVRRAVEYGPWLLHAAEEVDASEAAARGVPLSLTLAAPLWIANTTGLAMDVAVVAVAAPSRGASASPGASFSSRAARRDSGTARAPPPARGDLRRLVTDGGEGGGAARDLPAQRHVAPGSLELLSYPVPAWSSGGGGAGNDSVTASRSRAYGVRLRVAGSGWTPPLALEAGAAGASPGGDDSPLDGLEPVLVQARVREFGVTHEVVARLEVAPHAGSQILRLEPHVVVSNRTPLDVSLLHCAGLVERVAERGGAEVSAVILPRGASSFSAAPTTRSGQGAALRAGPGPRLVRPSAGLFGGDGGDGGAGGVQTSASPDPLAAPAPPRLMATGALVSMHAAAPALVLPAGACAVPLHLPLASRRHEVCLRLGGVGPRDGPALWSRPLTLRYPAEETLHVLAPCAAAGDGDARVALLRLSISRRAPGALLVVLESAGGDPPYSVENRSRVALQYRQAHVPGAPFHELAPFSATGWAWEHTLAGAAYRLELQEGAGEARAYALDAGAGVAGEGGGAAALDPLPLSVRPRSCAVVASYVEQTAAAPAGTARIEGDGPGGALGRGGVDRQLVVAPGAAGALTRSPRAALAPPPDRDLALQLEYLEVSITDAVPQELALVSLQRLAVNLAAGSTPAGTYRAATLALARIQVDDQLPGSRYPVVLAPAKGQGGDLPALQAAVTQHTGGARGHAFFPILAVRTPLVMQLAVDEPLIWRAQELLARLQAAAAGDGAGGGSKGTPGATRQPSDAPHHPDTAAADTMLRVRLLSISDLAAQVSFGSNPLARPRQVSGGAVSVILDLASFQAAAISLHGFELREETMLHSAFRAHVAQVVQGQVFGVGLSLVRNFGVIGGAGKVLGMLSAGVAKLSQSRSDLEQAAAAPVPETKPISNFGDGFAEGAGAFGSSILRGLRGVVEKPREGARQRGFQGALSGVAKGLVGAVADPISGALDAMSATAQGMDAFMSKSKAELLELGRRRLPRVMSVDGAVTPTLRDGSFREARMEELGQALLQNTLLAAREKLTRTGTVAERYEQHFLLPDNRVVVLTDRGILLLHAPGFDRLGAAADLGYIAVSDVPPGEVSWRVSWEDLLALELRLSRESPDAEPDRLIVHRKGVPGRQQEESLAHQIKGYPNTPQASQIKMVAQAVYKRRYLEPLRSSALWSARHAAALGAAPPTAIPADMPHASALPLCLPCLEFAPAWHTNPARAPCVSFWRPLAPAGYRPAADVVCAGLEPPAEPVPCFRDDAALRDARGPDPGAAPGPPPTAHPREFSLLWRSNARRAVAVWLPVAPRGYVALGAVVVGAPEAPSPEAYLCLREDLAAPARCSEAPVWRYDPVAAAAEAARAGGSAPPPPPAPGAAASHHPETWRVSVWRVEGGAPHFLAVRAFARPPDAWVRAYAGEAGASR
ncbi:hypothetical protein ACKKBG_A10495 [Auxenochlorella protothecoides x Auxenochlorella symbiontica]